MSWSDYVGPLVQAGGAAAGSIIPGAGTAAGAGIGSAIAGGLGMLDKDKQAKYPGPTPEEEKALFYSSEIARRAMSQTGISANTAGRIGQAGREESLSQIAEQNTFSRMLSPLDRQKLTQALTERSQKVSSTLMDKLEEYSTGRETQQTSVAAQAVGNMETIARAQSKAKFDKFEKELASRQDQFKSYVNSMSALSGALSNSLFNAPAKEAAAPTGPATLTTTGQPKTTEGTPNIDRTGLMQDNETKDYGLSHMSKPTAPKSELKASDVTGGIENLSASDYIDVMLKDLKESMGGI